MSQPESTSRISIAANRGVTGTLFILAITTYAIRTYIRARILKQFSTEDVLLLFAVVCLCGTTGLAYSTVQSQYDSIALILHGGGNGLLFDILDKVADVSKKENAASTLWWFVIFPVKLAFLFFFRRLISRLRNLNIWWWCVVVFTIPAGLVCVAVSWLTCPYFTIETVLSGCSGPSADYRTIRDTSITTVLDVVTDILVVSFPVAILWKVRINFRQKIGLAVSLCLSLVMVVVAVVRISGIKLAGGAVDIVWLAFWQQQECSIAVIMVSVSAFRSLFIANPSSSPSPKPPNSPTYWRKRLLRGRPASDQDGDEIRNGLPQIPRPILTGMRSMIQGAHISRLWSKGTKSEGFILQSEDSGVQEKKQCAEERKSGSEPCSTERTLCDDGSFVEGGNMV